MNGFKSSSWMAGCLAACAAVTGCHGYGSYNDIVDPCWPQRYSCMAREEVTTPHGIQASNGLALDQTVWNYHFVEGTDRLNAMGAENLRRMSRRRPGPVPEVYVQATQEVKVDVTKTADQNVAARNDLDGRRMKAVTDYLAALRPDVPFKVAVHDPAPVGLNGVEAATAIAGHLGAATGSINAAKTSSNNADRAGTQPDQQQNINVGTR